MSNQTTLPETRKVPEYVIETGQEMSAYQSVVTAYEVEACAVVGVRPMQLAVREYGERLMWRLTFEYRQDLTNDEAKRAAWQLLTRGFGAYKPEFFKSDNGEPGQFVGVWFTNGAKLLNRAIKF